MLEEDALDMLEKSRKDIKNQKLTPELKVTNFGIVKAFDEENILPVLPEVREFLLFPSTNKKLSDSSTMFSVKTF